MMRNTVLLLLSFLLVGITETFAIQEDQSVPALIPLPTKCEWGRGYLTLTPKATLSYPDDVSSIAQFFNQKIETAGGFKLAQKEKKGTISLRLIQDETLGNEGYHLAVSKKGIVVSANKPNGLFYGIQTLLQLLPENIKEQSTTAPDTKWTIPYVEITDVPAFGWRGLMLDVSRHFFTKEEVKKYIDELAEYKMNVFHWHLTDDQGWRIEIKQYPRLTEVGAFRANRVGQWWQREPQREGEATPYGGYYTQDDIREVVQYAADRFVRVIPEIDIPGHSLATLVAYPELACIKAPTAVNVGNKFYGIDENSICAGNEAAYTFFENIFTEVAALFPDEYIHVGGDECFKGFWNKCEKCQAKMKAEGLNTTNELQSYFIRRMEKIVKANGKKLIGWDEIHEGGLAPEATVMSWRGMQGGILAAQAGHHVIMTPNDHCYLDLYQGEPSVEPDTYSMCRLSDSYNFNPVPEGVDPEMILGGQGNLWAESVPTFRHAEYMTWPRGWALAEVLWTGTQNKDFSGFMNRVEQHFDRADRAEINYARSVYNAIIKPYLTPDKSVNIELSSELPDLDIYYTFDNTTPDRFSSRYQSPLSIPKDATWLRVVTYRGKEKKGVVITIPTSDLIKKAK